MVKDRPLVSFSTNNYLGISPKPECASEPPTGDRRRGADGPACSKSIHVRALALAHVHDAEIESPDAGRACMSAILYRTRSVAFRQIHRRGAARRNMIHGRRQLRHQASDALPIAPAPPVVSVVRSVVSEGEGRGFLVSFPRASQPTSMTPAPPDLNRTIRNHRFHSCHVGRQRCRMERSDVAGHQGSGECAHEGHSEGMHVFLRHLVSNASEQGCFGADNPQPGCRVPYRLRLVKRDKAPGGDGGNS